MRFKKRENKRQCRSLELHFGSKHEVHCGAAQLLRHMLERHLTFHSFSSAAASQKNTHRGPVETNRLEKSEQFSFHWGNEATGVGVARADGSRGRKPGRADGLMLKKLGPMPE